MKPIEVRNVKIGEGIPKICAPIIGKTKTEILAAAEEICKMPVDLLEWRADWYEDVFVAGQIQSVLSELRKIVSDTPILFTFRTKQEGGEREIDAIQYVNLLRDVIEVKAADMVDVEVYSMATVAQELIQKAHAKGMVVVGSNHDFEKTPEKDEIVKRLCHMQDLGVDISKIAVMPQCEDDVNILLHATREMATQYADRPIVTMSMSELGTRSRTEGEAYGSAITFGVAKQASAPGQIPVGELRNILERFHLLMEQ